MQSEHQAIASRSTPAIDTFSFPVAEPRSAAPIPIRSADNLPSDLFRYRFIKRLLDLLLIFLSLPLTIPVLGCIALVVLLSSPGPVFYSHRRIGRNGAFFSMWKFRTMCENSAEVLETYLTEHPRARAEWRRTHKLRFDPRVTPVGRLLRRYSLDELPQLWNIVSGRMTLVGPRPIVAAEVEKYGEGYNFYTRVTPGLTGLWQVSGRSELSYAARVALDCRYVEHWSLRRDTVILCRTLRSVVNQDGAY